MKIGVKYIKIDDSAVGQRIDNFLLTYLKSVPKSRIYRLLRKGEIRVNKKRAKPMQRLMLGDEIRLPPMEYAEQSEALIPSGKIDQIKKCILYEDNDIVVINKPSGLAVHGGSGVRFGVINILQAAYLDQTLFLVHRLDRETSGCLLIAKNRPALLMLHEAIREGAITKIYTALTLGHWRSERETVDVPLRRNQLQGGERMVQVDTSGKKSQTTFEVLQSYENASLVRAILHTGRTHQIRVHAASCNHPLAGDKKYGDKAFNHQMKALGLKRVFLHASALTFRLPSSGELITVEAPLDEILMDFLERLS